MTHGRPVTIEDVARLAGVSRAAASKVLRNAYGVSDQMRSRVLAASEQLGYTRRSVSRSSRDSSYVLGIEIPNSTNQFFPTLISGVINELADSEHQLITAPVRPNHEHSRAIDVLTECKVDGIVAIAPKISQDWLEELGQRLPLVVVGRHHSSVHYDTLVGDDFVGAELAVRHLHKLGHRRIVHLTLDEFGPDLLPEAPHGMRLMGYEHAMGQLGLDPEVVWGESGPESVYGEALRLLSRATDPVAMFVAHDELALEALQAVAELGLSAGQASVVGYDDTYTAGHARMSLTSVNQSGHMMGATAARLLLQRLAGRAEAAHEVIPPRLMARSSSAPPEPRSPQS